MTHRPLILLLVDETGPPDHAAAVQAMAAGIRSTEPNFQVEVGLLLIAPHDLIHRAVATVQFGIGKHAVHRSWSRQVNFDAARRNGTPVLIIEKGFVRRDEYFHVGWNGLNGYADFRNRGMPADRWDALGVPLLSPRTFHPTERPRVLLCGQVPWDSTVQHINYHAWLTRAYHRLCAVAGAEHVTFRPHPRAGKQAYGFEALHTSILDPLKTALAHHGVVAAYNSTTLVDAVIAGLRIMVENDMSVAWPLGGTSLTARSPDVEPWAHDLAYAQWTLEEMRDGAAWRHVARNMFR